MLCFFVLTDLRNDSCVRFSLKFLHNNAWLMLMARSLVVDHLQTTFGENDTVATTFNYRNYKEQAEQTASSLVESVAADDPTLSCDFRKGSGVAPRAAQCPRKCEDRELLDAIVTGSLRRA